MASINSIKISNNVFFKANARRNIGTNEVLMADVVPRNILYDYSERGIKSGNIKVFPCNVYNTNGTLSKDWSKGQILSVDDIVKITGKDGTTIVKNQNEEVLMRVVGRTFKYDGVPTIELELQEIKE